MICFDAEIAKAILGRNEVPILGIEYCAGWRDFEGMGIACVCTYEMDTHLSRVFLKADLPEMEKYLAEESTCGFNTRRFDIPLLAAAGVTIKQDTHFDLLEEIWLAQGLNPDKFNPQTHGGWGLDAICYSTFGINKSGSGAQAPIWWQQGKRGRVVDYCLRDTWMEAMAVRHGLMGKPFKAAGKPEIALPPRALRYPPPKEMQL